MFLVLGTEMGIDISSRVKMAERVVVLDDGSNGKRLRLNKLKPRLSSASHKIWIFMTTLTHKIKKDFRVFR
jgi:hypothetical protein